jgi:hypothetical protein
VCRFNRHNKKRNCTISRGLAELATITCRARFAPELETGRPRTEAYIVHFPDVDGRDPIEIALLLFHLRSAVAQVSVAHGDVWIDRF